jgi:hypothetical protein
MGEPCVFYSGSEVLVMASALRMPGRENPNSSCYQLWPGSHMRQSPSLPSVSLSQQLADSAKVSTNSFSVWSHRKPIWVTQGCLEASSRETLLPLPHPIGEETQTGKIPDWATEKDDRKQGKSCQVCTRFYYGNKKERTGRCALNQLSNQLQVDTHGRSYGPAWVQRCKWALML